MKISDLLQLCPFLRLTPCLILGIVAGYYAGVSTMAWLLLLLVSIFISVVFLFVVSKEKHILSVVQSIVLFLSVFFFGAWIEGLHAGKHKFICPDSARQYSAVVYSSPARHGKVYMADLLLCDEEFAGRKIKASFLADSLHCPRLGDGIEFFSSLSEPQNYTPDFDYRIYLLRHGYVAQTFFTMGDMSLSEIDISCLSRIDRLIIEMRKLRETLNENYLSVDDGNHDVAAVVAAITLGDKSSLTKELKEAYSISGGSHILALSGLHLGILYAVLVFLLGRRMNAWKQLLALVAVWSFVILVGCSYSVVRSAVMLSVYGVLSIMRRGHLPLNTWAMALFIMLVSNPWSIFDVGMQMSFLAVLSILIYYKPIYRMLPVVNPLVRWIWGMVCVSVSAQIAVAPLIAFYFHRFSLWFVLTNFIVIPCATVVLCLFLFSWIVMFADVLHGFVVKVLYFFVKLMNTGVEWVASFPMASVEGININVIQLFGIYLCIICITYIVSKMQPVFSLHPSE